MPPPRGAEPRILLVEDRPALARMLERALVGKGHRVSVAHDANQARAALAATAFDLALTDLRLPGGSGLEVVSACHAATPPVPVVVMTAFGTVANAVEAMKRGAVDFLEKPVDLDDLFALVETLLGEAGRGSQGAVSEEIFEAPGAPPIVGSHPRLKAALHLLSRVAATESTVLLTGESGTGKELFARALHALSPRAAGPFVAVNCAAIPETLVENELFGHEKGAFTGAGRKEPGRFEVAGGGTLLLDEVGELPLAVQAKVLRVLEQKTFERVGGSKPLTADVRLVAATNRELAAMVEAGGFRQDLYFRLEVFPIRLPPLRERASDIPPLARYLLDSIAARLGREAPDLSGEAEELLAEQSWPGNVRQLANVLERALILAEGPRIDAPDLELLLAPVVPGNQRETLRRALVQADGDKRRAAEILNWSYRTVLRRVKEHDLDGVPRYRSG